MNFYVFWDTLGGAKQSKTRLRLIFSPFDAILNNFDFVSFLKKNFGGGILWIKMSTFSKKNVCEPCLISAYYIKSIKFKFESSLHRYFYITKLVILVLGKLVPGMSDTITQNFERNTSSTHFLFHFIGYVWELLKSLHCYHTNCNNVNHGQ